MDKLKNNKYKTILADPPWDINQKGKRGAARHYPLMTLDQIKAMPVKDLSERECPPYLWIPNGLLQEGLDVIKAWGFTYRSMLTWGSQGSGLDITSAVHLRQFCSPPVDTHPSSSTARAAGCSRPCRSIPTSRRNSSPSLSGSRTGHIWNCLPAGGSPAGTPGATRSTATL